MADRTPGHAGTSSEKPAQVGDRGEEDRKAQPGTPPAADSSESSTGGFDTALGMLVVRGGLCTLEEVDACRSDLKQAEDEGVHTLSDLLVKREYLTQHQLNRLRSDHDARRSGQRIPGYTIKKKLGSGAMATVFLARQLSLDRLVAIKILPTKFSSNTKFIERFYKEGRAAAQLNHPNIIGAYDVGEAAGHHYFVMEYVDGYSVYEHLKGHSRYVEPEALLIIKQVAEALQHAHDRGFIHRDIKPKNVMITQDGVAKLADLGLARAMTDTEAAKAEEGRAYGTPYYISPEQIRGELEIGPAADLYGLGCCLYHMVTGRVPFEGKNPSQVMHKHLRESPEAPDHVNPVISAGCAQIIEKMMAKDPQDRYHCAADLLEDLALVAAGNAPHYARGTLDHTAIVNLITPGEVPLAQPMIPARDGQGEGPPAFSAVLTTVLILSILLNLVLLLILLV